MEQTGSGQESMKEFQVLALVDYDEHAWDGKRGQNGDPDHRGDAVLYCIRKDHKNDSHQYSIAAQPAEVLTLVDPGKTTQRAEANMGDPETLRKFVSWGIDHFPAQKYALVVWGDGNGYGWKVNPALALGPGNDTKRVVTDTQDVKMDALEMLELRTALQQVKSKINAGSQYKSGTGVARNLDLLGFDMGHMALIEVARQVQDSVDVMAASEERIRSEGWPYKEFLTGLLCQRQGANWNCDLPKNSDADALGKHAVKEYHTYFEAASHKDDKHTLSAVRLNPKAGDTFVNPCEFFNALVGCVDSLAIKLRAGVEDVLGRDNPADNVQIKIKHEGREPSEQMQDENYIDLRHFAKNVDGSSIPAAYKTPHAGDIYAALSLSGKIVLANEHGSAHPNAHGLTIYFPHDQLLPEELCKPTPDRDKARECGFDNPLPSPVLYAKDAEILAPILRQPAASPTHPRVQIPGLRFPDENSWDEFLHRYYKPVADACIRYGGACVKSVIIFVGETVTLSGAGSSDSDGPAEDDIPQHWYWDLNPLIDTGGVKPTYPVTSTSVIDDPCSEDCDRDDADEADDDKDADAKSVAWTCPAPGSYSFRLIPHDEHNEQAAQHGEENHYVHWKLDDDAVSLVCIAGKISTPTPVIPENKYTYAVTIPAQPSLTGPVAASFSDPLPAMVDYVVGSCSACTYDAPSHTVSWQGEITPGESKTVEFEVFLPVERVPITWPPIQNLVTIHDGVYTHAAVTETPLQCVPVKRSSRETVSAGEQFGYTIALPAHPTTTGPVNASVQDPLSPLVEFVEGSLTCSHNQPQCQYNEGSHTVSWNGLLQPGEQLVMTFDVTTSDPLPPACPPEIINQAQLFDGVDNRLVQAITTLDCGP
ncbi:MAG: hypothetical protein HC802_19145 [Caldilineaceae bacterium]|nr:hypothetical protein [Caldilineaceae bacterium]